MDYIRDPHNDWGDDYALPFKPPTPFVDAFEHMGMTYDQINQAAAEEEAYAYTDEVWGYDGFGAPLYAHQIDPQGTE